LPVFASGAGPSHGDGRPAPGLARQLRSVKHRARVVGQWPGPGRRRRPCCPRAGVHFPGGGKRLHQHQPRPPLASGSGGQGALTQAERARLAMTRPAGCRPSVAVWLAHVSPTRGGEEPGTIRKEAASGRGSCVELTISASPAALAGLRRAARGALREVPTQVADEMLLALDEAATNAILYGSRGGDPVEVAVRVGDAWVEATVLDHGPTGPPRPPSATDRLSGGGWGLWLLRCLVDEVRLERVELGTRVTLRRRIRPRSPVAGVGRHPSAARALS
jgi:anti-sigma regulatory factor (Ser/Thr protein kinase)